VKKLVIFAILAVTFIPYVWGAMTAPTSFVASAPTPTKITLTWSGQSTLDSLAIIHFSGSDSLFIAYVDSAQTDTTLTSLTPNTQYILGMYVVSGAGKAVCTKDTMNTDIPYKMRFTSAMTEGSAFVPDYNWDPAESDSTNPGKIVFTLNASAETATTCFFKPQAYTVIAPILLNAVEDSCKFTGIIYGGWDDSTETRVGNYRQGIDVIGDAPADTISVTSHLQASNAATKVSILPYDWAYIVWTGDTDCGNNQQFMIKLGWSKD